MQTGIVLIHFADLNVESLFIVWKAADPISAWYNAHKAPIHVATHVDFVLHAVDVIQWCTIALKEDLFKDTDEQSL